ncbi:putative transmembrane prostate androgen-induced protein-like [Scophthalmus maximus]|uniref:Putative transmembrane prostate androgen-induced protein-like n=1 Tax=Scophthalmus maximus TaxID=52904 RepID=A0A2U9BEL9_SCOMX|nr:putative transmembrane prostate androgen-induced protein-like [Scophthalmus maximus]
MLDLMGVLLNATVANVSCACDCTRLTSLQSMEISEYRCDVTSVSVCVTMLSSVVTINFLPPPVASGFELDPEPPPLSEPSRTEPDPRVVRSRCLSARFSAALLPLTANFDESDGFFKRLPGLSV